MLPLIAMLALTIVREKKELIWILFELFYFENLVAAVYFALALVFSYGLFSTGLWTWLLTKRFKQLQRITEKLTSSFVRIERAERTLLD